MQLIESSKVEQYTIFGVSFNVEYEAENNEDRIEKVNSVSQEKDIRFSVKDEVGISYESLIAKPDMKIVAVSEKSIEQKTRKNIVDEARKNVKKYGKTDGLGRLTIKNQDTKNDIVIGAPAIRHGLTRNYETNAMIALHLGEYLNNAVKINEIEARGINSTGGYILLGYGRNELGEQYPAYFVIQTLTTGKAELIEFDALYSINGKKISEAVGVANQGVQSLTSDTITIPKLLDVVNGLYSDILPLSVAEHYGNERRETKLGKSVKYSAKDDNETPVDRFEGVIPSEDEMFDYVNMNETEFVEVPPVRDYEFDKKRVRQQTYELNNTPFSEYRSTEKRLEKSVQKVENVVNKMSETITDFSGFLKPTKEKALFDVSDCIKSAVSLMEESINHHKLTVSVVSEEHNEVYGYSNEMTHVIFNVLNNARDAIVQYEPEDRTIFVKMTQVDDRIEIQIENKGTTIPPDVLEHIFGNNTPFSEYRSTHLFLLKNRYKKTRSPKNIRVRSHYFLTPCNSSRFFSCVNVVHRMNRIISLYVNIGVFYYFRFLVRIKFNNTRRI